MIIVPGHPDGEGSRLSLFKGADETDPSPLILLGLH